MLRHDFVCPCGSPLEPSEPYVDPPIVDRDGAEYFVGVCCEPECDAPDVEVPVHE